jgi:Uma2 family endonuclease
MRQANIKFTYRDYLLLPEDKRYEIVEGELFLNPAPNLYHQRISRELLPALCRYVREHSMGEIFNAPCDVVFSEENVVQPDLLFVSRERAGILAGANVQGAPDLVIEILSDATAKRDLGIKRKLYAKYGVCEYWIVDSESKSIEVLSWTESGYRTEAVYPRTASLSSPLFPNLNLSLPDIFRT